MDYYHLVVDRVVSERESDDLWSAATLWLVMMDYLPIAFWTRNKQRRQKHDLLDCDLHK